ncbi:hypothetical protein V9T40_014184 [Parthenolecanium corni]|uniref:Uncharacterized protein n=1 Tax=Parthenolecanium corni TaxID=536013 RepID=A0AAN9TE20_9HEMI
MYGDHAGLNVPVKVGSRGTRPPSCRPASVASEMMKNIVSVPIKPHEAVSDVDEVVSAKELSEEGEEFSEEKDWDEVEVLVDELSDEEVLSVEEELSSDDEDESVTGSVVSSSGG